MMKTDQELQRHVLAELNWEPRVDAAKVGVSVEGGVVTLTGHVPVLAAKQVAEDATKRVHGVMAVANDIDVSLGSQHKQDDTDIAAAALHALQWNVHVPEDDVQLTVANGWIHLEGYVDHNYQKEAAGKAVSHLVGALGVTNSIRVEPSHERRSHLQENSQAVCDRVELAMRRSAALNARDVSVAIDGCAVVLSGDVHTHAEFEEAERAAWAAPGVSEVRNTITITPWGSGPAEEWGY